MGRLEILLASTSSSATSPNIRTNLAGERAYVKKKMVDHELSQASITLFLKNKCNLSPDGQPTTPKRRRFLSEEVSTLTPTPTQDHSPIPSPCELNFGATPTVAQRNVDTWEQEPIESYDSDTSIELPDPLSFIPPPTSSRFASNVSTSTAPSTIPSSRNDSTEPNLTTPFLSPPTGISKTPKWPAHFFAVDIANCFDEVEDNAGEARVRSIFERHFGQWVSYKRSTF